MKTITKGIIGIGTASVCAIGAMIVKAVKIVSDDRKNMSDTEREMMNMPIEVAEEVIKHMWNLGEKYIEEHPEAEFRGND